MRNNLFNLFINSLIFNLIYNEIIMLYFYNLDNDTIKNFVQKANDEINILLFEDKENKNNKQLIYKEY